MRLVVLYGLPATGKLIVAKELAARTGYRLFHHHLVVDTSALQPAEATSVIVEALGLV